MLNLLRSDLYRMTRIRGLRGNLWQYASVLLFIACLEGGPYLVYLAIRHGPGGKRQPHQGAGDAIFLFGKHHARVLLRPRPGRVVRHGRVRIRRPL